MKIQINGDEVFVSKMEYRENGRIALLAEQDNEYYAMLTVNLPNEHMDQDEVAINVNNLGMRIISQLVKQSIIKYPRPDKWVRSGFVEYPICKLVI